jgi:hypothetical protein
VREEAPTAHNFRPKQGATRCPSRAEAVPFCIPCLPLSPFLSLVVSSLGHRCDGCARQPFDMQKLRRQASNLLELISEWAPSYGGKKGAFAACFEVAEMSLLLYRWYCAVRSLTRCTSTHGTGGLPMLRVQPPKPLHLHLPCHSGSGSVAAVSRQVSGGGCFQSGKWGATRLAGCVCAAPRPTPSPPHPPSGDWCVPFY